MITAAFFQGKGKNVVTENEFIMDISMKLRWMQPSQAKHLLPLFLSCGHMTMDGEFLRPAFDVNTVDIPFGYRPSADAIAKRMQNASVGNAAPPADLLGELLATAERSGIKKKDIVVSANAVQKKINVDIEIAALLIMRENGIDISEYIERSYGTILNR